MHFKFSQKIELTVTSTTRYQISASACLIALIFLCLAWEGWLAPLKPGGSWMVLKGAFLLVPLFGILRGKRYTYKWLSLFVQFYLMEGLLRATSDHGLIQQLAVVETILATALFVLTILFVRATRGPKTEKAAQQS
ncbi:MAG: DUF2069 domain-containing protein [Gammaproteobacteria bacterium]|nr:DUF2069 domain-containing protein [Gammaproteobacteria bacterium]MBU1601505.1 DUF2069 domain-containing protein [Gammaproteobacteria bacterium]MBU2433700.1 DUF2069 domain-containing protein [Gammaproteobacteria bacterium]MBU2449762.1 DUF2069 domain-containing protein [Gammaproteobacteria bacterium]